MSAPFTQWGWGAKRGTHILNLKDDKKYAQCTQVMSGLVERLVPSRCKINIEGGINQTIK